MYVSRNVGNRSNKRWPDRKIIEKYCRGDNNLFWQGFSSHSLSFICTIQSTHQSHTNIRYTIVTHPASVCVVVFNQQNCSLKKLFFIKIDKRDFSMVREWYSNKEKLPTDHRWQSHKTLEIHVSLFRVWNFFATNIQTHSHAAYKHTHGTRRMELGYYLFSEIEIENRLCIHGWPRIERKVIVFDQKWCPCACVHNLKIVWTNSLIKYSFEDSSYMSAFSFCTSSCFSSLTLFLFISLSTWMLPSFGSFCTDHDGIELHHHLTKFQFQLLKHIISSHILECTEARREKKRTKQTEKESICLNDMHH